jgi:hypothetical protein
MGILSKMLGLERKKEKPYIDGGVTLIHKLTATLSLPDWKHLVPTYTEEEVEAINRSWSNFQKTANQAVGGDAKFHPDAAPIIQRTLAAEALAELAEHTWKYSDELPTDWRHCVSTYLKAWAAHFSPLTLLDLGDLLVKAGYRTEAKGVFQVLLLFPTYADTYYAGHQNLLELVQNITDSAKERLRELG